MFLHNTEANYQTFVLILILSLAWESIKKDYFTNGRIVTVPRSCEGGRNESAIFSTLLVFG